jgi:hypothetical protein
MCLFSPASTSMTGEDIKKGRLPPEAVKVKHKIGR